jgi:RNA polymerase sigma-70 factor (ECF subfamily)
MLAVADIEKLPVEEARRGDPGAWDTLFRRYQMPLYVYACELLRDEQASLDVVQESFVAASRHLCSLRSDEKFGSWLFGIARQKCAQRWRQSAREEMALETVGIEPVESEPGADECLIRKEQEGEFLRRLGELPEPQREVLVLFFLEEFSLEEISRITRVGLGTVKSRLHYARKAMRRLLENKPL